jgi:hypothetical protein
VRGKKQTGTVRLPETLGVEASIARLRRNLDQFLDRVDPAGTVRR